MGQLEWLSSIGRNEPQLATAGDIGEDCHVLAVGRGGRSNGPPGKQVARKCRRVFAGKAHCGRALVAAWLNRSKTEVGDR